MPEAGQAQLYTRRQLRRLAAAAVLTVLGGIAAVTVAVAASSALAGRGWQWPHLALRPLVDPGLFASVPGADGGSASAAGFPIGVRWPATSPATVVPIAVTVLAAWVRLVVWPILRGFRAPARLEGLADVRDINRKLGRQAVRRAGLFTLPTHNRLRRFRLTDRAFGYRLLTPARPAGKNAVWADWEQRIRLIARTGWGKAARILVPVIRELPGPALISSTEPAIFEQTVLSRSNRSDPVRWWLRTPLQACRRGYPVVVADFSDPNSRWSAGWPTMRWDPIPACIDHTVAYRRAQALIAGADTSNDRGSDSDRFFRSSASEVLAAWLHAAALGRKNITDLLQWVRKPDDPTPRRILDDDPRADPSAVPNLTTHLDARAEKTTSGVLRYLALALNSIATVDGQQLCAPARPGHPEDLTNIEQLIRGGGTIYLLADPSRIDRARPLLSLLAAEVFLAAERVALNEPQKRLAVPFIAVLDELRYGVTVPNLPYVASAQRKYGIGFIYAVQSSSQEDAVYGDDAAALRDAAGVTIIGGIDIGQAEELSDRAGTAAVVTASRGTGNRSEHVEQQAALTIADQQQLNDGDAVVFARGLKPFIGRANSVYDQRRTFRRISAETRLVQRNVATAVACEEATADLDPGMPSPKPLNPKTVQADARKNE